MKMGRFRAALIQMDSGNSWKENKKKAEDYVQEAVTQRADYIQFPETADYIGSDFGRFAKEHAGEVEAFFSELAKKYGVYLNCGSITEYQKQGKPKNTAIFFAPDGNVLGKYSKLHLFDIDVKEGPCYKESDEIAAGDEVVTAAADIGIFGLSICYDLRFPELYRKIAAEGAQILCVAANFTKQTGQCHWRTLLQARAIENTCYVLASAQCGIKPKFQAYGHSIIIDPWGEVILELEEKPGIGVADINLERIEEVRGQLPCLKNRRSDIFG